MIENTSFSGHETFPLRYGWLKKGVEAVKKSTDFYSDADQAMVELGVGKNMVNSIKYWSQVTGFLSSFRNSENSRIEFKQTELAEKIISTDLYDPYLEDPATLWLLHWQIASNAEQCTTWYFLFNLLHRMEFTKDQLIAEIHKWLEEKGLPKANNNSLKRDVDVCIRTYVHTRGSKNPTAEDSLDCPLTEINLLSALEKGKSYKFVRSERTSLPDEIFLYALEKFWTKKTDTKSIGLESITYDPGSPGQIFKIDQDSIVGRLERIARLSGNTFRYDETAGLKQVYREKLTSPLIWLDNYYKNVSKVYE